MEDILKIRIRDLGQKTIDQTAEWSECRVSHLLFGPVFLNL